MKYQPLFNVGEKVLYSSLTCSGAAHGEIISIEGDPHQYTIKPDLALDKTDTVLARDIQSKL